MPIYFPRQKCYHTVGCDENAEMVTDRTDYPFQRTLSYQCIYDRTVLHKLAETVFSV